MSDREDLLKDRWFGLGFLAALSAINKEPEKLETARQNAERMVTAGRRALSAADGAKP